MTINEALGCHLFILRIIICEVALAGDAPFCPLLLLSSSAHRACIISTHPRPLKALDPSHKWRVFVSHISHTCSPTSHFPDSHCSFSLFPFLCLFSRKQRQAGLFCSYYFPFVFKLARHVLRKEFRFIKLGQDWFSYNSFLHRLHITLSLEKKEIPDFLESK